jgi:DNA-directed RNA polymerase specialized sigma24 family protein
MMLDPDCYGRAKYVVPTVAGASQPTVFDNAKHDRADSVSIRRGQVIQQQPVENVRQALKELPADFREVIVLRA